ncbi:sensor histidine kinase [Seleniivibrio woodruffii]|uniref:histidine kinase n=1 Tax=Seleniivibrio woodruffii TaxID=1078050 RepID=A0A4R1KEW9_9BACT|nr:HAMP domain-containing sensor histidine kinase [Seleniivibrio woodruffii]TCK62697.1 signal transduction histidine kinase [Seleniivibrio woodruffii]TVZ36878.1 signal transduction histidine kinase [Seleniivibrio woodruffii]
MKYRSSLRRRIILVFIGYSLLLSSLTVIAVIVATRISETRSMENRLKVEAEYYLSAYLASFAAPTSNAFNALTATSPYITHYYGEDLLPHWVAKKLPALKPGTYFTDNDKQRYCILIKKLPDGDKFYLLYNVTRQHMNDDSLVSLQRTILLTLLPILIFGVTLGLITAHKVIGPVIRLGKIIRERNPKEKLPDDFDSKFNDDEIGLLAATLKSALNSMQESVERETSFARDASHELRTPVTTIKNSLELLEIKRPDFDDDTKKILGRLNRATANMEHLIKSFLWLSRHRNLDKFERRDIRVADVVQEIIQENAYLIDNKPVEVVVHDAYEIHINVEPQLIKILIANLIRNSFTYTKSGTVDIYLSSHCIQVHDSGTGIKGETLLQLKNSNAKNHAEGFGFGLAIVRRLCVSLGWDFYLSSEPNVGTQARICYEQPKNACTECKGLFMNNMAD